MIIVEKRLIPAEILKDSVLVHLAAAYYSVGKQLEQKTNCSQTRGFVMSTLRGGAALNQNQIATLLGFDRTVVHRVIRTLIQQRTAGGRGKASGSIDIGRDCQPAGAAESGGGIETLTNYSRPSTRKYKSRPLAGASVRSAGAISFWRNPFCHRGLGRRRPGVHRWSCHLRDR